MVDEDILPGSDRKGIHFFLQGISRAETEVADNHLVRIEIDTLVLDADALAGRGLPGQGDIGVSDFELGLEGNEAGHPEDHNPWPLRFTRRPKAPRPGIIQVGHCDDSSTTAPDGFSAKSLRTREGGNAERGLVENE